MKTSLTVRILRNDFGKIGRRMHDGLAGVVKEGTFAAVALIKRNIVVAGIVDTGNYLGSWQVGFESPLHGVAYSNVHYGPYQEFGTFRMAARPHVKPIERELQPWLSARAAAVMKAAG